MRPIMYVCVALVVAIPSVVHAGQVYGTIVMDGKGVGGANVEITCGSAPAVTGTTGADGRTESTWSRRDNARSCSRAMPASRP